MTIIYSIRNVTSELVHTVMLRKFFQMIFVGEDKKSLHIYTATILGASKQKLEEKEFEDKNFLSDLGELNQFRMRFEFAVSNCDDNEVTSIKHENITEENEHDFLKEIECIRNIWGEQSKIIHNNQTELLEQYKKFMGSDKSDKESNIKDDEKKEENKIIKLTAQLAQKKVLWTEENKNSSEDDLLQSLAIAGEFKELQAIKATKEREKIVYRRSYTISVPNNEHELPKGIELVNWIRTTIEFRYSIEDAGHNFTIRKENNGDCIFLAPDFTWYFTPIIRSYIDSRNSTVEVKYATKEGSDGCVCPFKKENGLFVRNDKFQNSINPVPNKMTVNFSYWTNREKIQQRQKYRLATKDIFPRAKNFNDMSQISIFLDTSDEHNRSNRQFLIGILLSIILSFGIDSNRLRDIEYCFIPINCFLTSDVAWVLFFGLFALTWINKPLKLNVKSRKKIAWRKWNLLLSGIWCFFTFVLLRISKIHQLIEEHMEISKIGWGMGIFLILLSVSHIAYFFTNGGLRLIKDLLKGDIM